MNIVLIKYNIIHVLNNFVKFYKLSNPYLLLVHTSLLFIFGHTAFVRVRASAYDSRSKHAHKGTMSVFVNKFYYLFRTYELLLFHALILWEE